MLILSYDDIHGMSLYRFLDNRLLSYIIRSSVHLQRYVYNYSSNCVCYTWDKFDKWKAICHILLTSYLCLESVVIHAAHSPILYSQLVQLSPFANIYHSKFFPRMVYNNYIYLSSLQCCTALLMGTDVNRCHNTSRYSSTI